MTANESKYMIEAFDIAFSHFGRTSLNPSIGAVIVKEGKVLSSGGTCPFGGDHAEVTAIKTAEKTHGSKSEKMLKGASMYVSLEPCSHHGKTPPCTDAIINAGISSVYIPVLDPNPLVSGKGVSALRHAGIDVTMMNDMAGYGIDMIRPFRKSILRKKPFIIYKSAVTLDGRTATEIGDSKWISSDYSRYIVHKMRAKVDAIIIGKNTFMQDNPTLDVRLESFDDDIKGYFDGSSISMNGRDNYFVRSLIGSAIDEFDNPLRVVIGLPGCINLSSPFFKDDNYLFFTNKEELDRTLEKKDISQADLDKINIVIIDGKSRDQEINKILDELALRGIMTAMLEGGSTLAGAFLDAGQIDQFIYFITPKIIGKGLNSINSMGVQKISQSHNLHDISSVMVKDDIVYSAYGEPYHFEMF
ncbi:bifunctional diaminohydroxyphosphoribosylaminopyrimidine deaminase/5-amino-6-(5-phosphoribosylamino)uracil reductase RibD [Spirochaetota bacterium]